MAGVDWEESVCSPGGHGGPLKESSEVWVELES